MERIVRINNKFYPLKFGIGSLIVLNENSNLNEQDMKELQFFLAIGHNQVSFEESQLLLEELQKTMDVDILLSQVLSQSLGAISSVTSAIRVSPTLNDQIEELYQKAVGEIGIAPQNFYDMTPHEIELAYKGYLNKKITEANLQMTACRKAMTSNTELIRLSGKDVKLSTIAEREDTFKNLGI